MDSLHLIVAPHGERFVATSTEPRICSLGESPEEATEGARLVALAMFGSGVRPPMLIVRITQPGLSTLVMQPLEKPFTIESMVEKVDWRYMASVPGPVLKLVH